MPCRYLLNSLLVCVCFTPIGCSSMPSGPCSRLFANRNGTHDLGNVMVAQMTSSFISRRSIPISESARSIGDVLPLSTQVTDQPFELTKQAWIDEASVDEYRRWFNDNCVILERGSETWYFLDPLNAMAVVKNIRLQKEDSIVSMPFDKTVFHSERPNVDSEITIYGVASEGPQVLVRQGKTDENNLSSLATDPTFERRREIWTATIVTRSLGQSTHHLVLAAGNAMNTAPLTGGGAARFQTGDVIELTNLASLAQRF